MWHPPASPPSRQDYKGNQRAKGPLRGVGARWRRVSTPREMMSSGSLKEGSHRGKIPMGFQPMGRRHVPYFSTLPRIPTELQKGKSRTYQVLRGDGKCLGFGGSGFHKLHKEEIRCGGAFRPLVDEVATSGALLVPCKERFTETISEPLTSPESGAPAEVHLQFTNTLLVKELQMGERLHTYNNIYCEVERVDNLYIGQEEISEDEDYYKSDLMSIKDSGLHKIAAKLEVFPCKDLFSIVVGDCVLERGLLASPAGTMAIITGLVFQDLYRMPQLDLVLYGEADTDHVNQFWVPLLGEIILNDRKPDLSEVLAYNIHKNWGISKTGKSFFMASYVVDVCCAYLDFRHPLFPEWPNPSGTPIHILFSALYIYNYHQHIVPICDSPISKGATTVTPLNLSRGIQLLPSLSLKPTPWQIPNLTIPAPIFTLPLSLAKVDEVGSTTSKPLEVTLEYDRATNSLKKVTKRKIKTGDQVTTLQTEENLLLLTQKRRRVGWGANVDDRELIVDPVSIVRDRGIPKRLVLVLRAGQRSQSQRQRDPSSNTRPSRVDRGMGEQVGHLGECRSQKSIAQHIIVGTRRSGHVCECPGQGQIGLTPMVRLDNSLCIEEEFDATLGEFTKVKGNWGQGKGSLYVTFLHSSRKGAYLSVDHISIDPLARESIPWRIRRISMDQQAEKGNPEKSKGVQHSPTHVAQWEAYLMAKEMTRSLKAGISGLDKSIKGVQEELRQVKDATQSVWAATIHVLHELSPIRHKLLPSARHHPPMDEASGS
eukprot:Gb_23998 [translate_table: standard]